MNNRTGPLNRNTNLYYLWNGSLWLANGVKQYRLIIRNRGGGACVCVFEASGGRWGTEAEGETLRHHLVEGFSSPGRLGGCICHVFFSCHHSPPAPHIPEHSLKRFQPLAPSLPPSLLLSSPLPGPIVPLALQRGNQRNFATAASVHSITSQTLSLFFFIPPPPPRIVL